MAYRYYLGVVPLILHIRKQVRQVRQGTERTYHPNSDMVNEYTGNDCHCSSNRQLSLLGTQGGRCVLVALDPAGIVTIIVTVRMH